MKKIFVVILALLSMGAIAYAGQQVIETPSVSSNSPQVCQFSLSSYTGKIDHNGDTNSFKVGLSCPQQNDIYATVVVFINGEYIASKVVKVPAGCTESAVTDINVGRSYEGSQYKLAIQ